MRAATVRRYGPPETVRIETLPDPSPGRGEVLVRVHATSVTAGDARIRAARFPPGFGALARLGIGVRGPRRPILGVVFSGTVERLGADTARAAGALVPRVGDEVAGMTGMRMGAHAQLLAVPAARLVRKPPAISHSDAAAALFGGSAALHFLRDRATIRRGQRVLVNGASGAVGSAAVQLAHAAGAQVTAVCRARNHAVVRALGAQHEIDYTTQEIQVSGETYDLVFDAAGSLTLAEGRALITPKGALVLAAAGLGDTLRARGRVYTGSAPERPQDFAFLLDLVASGEFDPLTRVLGGLGSIPEAHRIIDTGHKVGNLVVLPQEA